MPGIVGVLGDRDAYTDKQDLLDAINLLGIAGLEVLDLETGFMAAASFEDAPLKGPRLVSRDTLVGGFAGDLVDVPTVPWDTLLEVVKSERYGDLADLRGNFGFAIYDLARKRCVLATDPRSQHPVFHMKVGKGLVFSTELSAFSRLGESPSFSIDWFYETMFFNFPVTPATFFEGVHRVPPGSVVVYDLDSGKQSVHCYVRPYERSDKLLKGKEALDRALEVFSSRVPPYFEGVDGSIGLSLTGGWDSRAILALCPDHLRDSLRIYTYGSEGCEDLVEAAVITKRLGLDHLLINFGEEFAGRLPQLMADVVYLSNGLERVKRAPVLYALRILTDHGSDCPAIITGISFDAMFKGYGNVPSMISPGIDRVFSTGKAAIERDWYADIFESRYDDFHDHIMGNLDSIRTKYGDYATSDCYLTYIVYDVCPNVFLGEMAMANQYSTFRVPCWDEDIVWLAYQTEYSRLTFSQYYGTPDPCEQNKIHIRILRSNPDFAGLPVSGIPLGVWWRGCRVYDLYRKLVRAPLRLLGVLPRFDVPLASWRRWMTVDAGAALDQLIFSQESLIREYVGHSFLARQKRERDTHWLDKLARVELILRLMSNRWRPSGLIGP
jgi:asparagine synthetase B (glutamine-hydrolysing)